MQETNLYHYCENLQNVCHPSLYNVAFSFALDDYNGATAFSLQLSAANDRDCVEIPINDDLLVEGDEFFLAELQLDPDAGNDNDTTLDVSSAEINIEDNDCMCLIYYNYSYIILTILHGNSISNSY